MSNNDAGTRIAAYLARCGLGSRRACETLVTDGRVSVNGQPIDHPSFKVVAGDEIALDGEIIKAPEDTKVWRYHKASGVICTRSDPQDRTTLFSQVEPRVLAMWSLWACLDFNTEGLILLTNNGALARHLELPSKRLGAPLSGAGSMGASPTPM
jgi:16S rRNA uridine-516 pseudouridylate synthase and related pseudouridylate synthases